MRSSHALSLSLALIRIAPALGQEAKVSDGRDIALKVCAVCRVVAAFAPTLNPPAPSFADIGARPNVTEGFLRDFLRSLIAKRGL